MTMNSNEILRSHSSLRMTSGKHAAFTLAEGATHVAMPLVFSKAGFTLAEVLITLGIIGVVAAITIPGLITKCQKTIVENRLKSSYSIIANAVRLSEEENGTGFSPDFGGTGWGYDKSKRIFEQYFMPYIKINYRYPWNECIILTQAYASASGAEQYIDYNNVCYSLMNGVAITFAAGSNSDGINRMSFRIVINPTKKRRIEGRDVFQMFAINGENGYSIGSIKYMDSKNVLTNEKLREYCASPKARIDFAGGSWGRSGFCLELIKSNGWKIPANYPIKF